MLSVLGGALTRTPQLIRFDLKSIRKNDRREVEQTLTTRKHHEVCELPPPDALDLLVTRPTPPLLGRSSSVAKAGEQESQKEQLKQ